MSKAFGGVSGVMGDVIVLLASSNPLDHVVDKPLPGGLSMNAVTMVIVAGLLVLTLKLAADAIATGPESQGNERYMTKGKFGQMVEVIVLYMRDNIIKPQLGDDTNKFLPYLLTLFFFILYNNLLGLVPLTDIQHLAGSLLGLHFSTWIGGTATANIAITAALAIIAFIVIQVSGLRSNGLGGWAKHFLGGAPVYLAPIMVPVEIMGMFIKPFALAIRLFANMTAGHTLLATLLMFTLLAFQGLGPAGGIPVTIGAALAMVPLMFLELFVAFLQAFIFMFLTTVFIAQLRHHEHHDHEPAEAYTGGEHSAVEDLAVPVTA
ncbi:MAG: F0F1 ATP synthase subunit A [Phycisphaerales bacterium]|nr:F0F1 ATP synthase subunit A [Phycisphaerales bacterium]